MTTILLALISFAVLMSSIAMLVTVYWPRTHTDCPCTTGDCPCHRDATDWEQGGRRGHQPGDDTHTSALTKAPHLFTHHRD